MTDGARSAIDDAGVARIFRSEFGRAVATLVRVFRDIDVAEDAVQEAFFVATERWPKSGPPPNPGGCITTTARRKLDAALIGEGQAIVRVCLRRNQPGPYQLQAAIAAVHSDAATAAAPTGASPSHSTTSWSRSTRRRWSPLNRAVALAEVADPEAALALVDDLDLDSYHPLHVTRADLLRRLGRLHEAAGAYETAAALTANAAERDFLDRRRWSLLGGG